MNKNCPFCGKRVTRKQDHVFVGGERCHRSCLDEAGDKLDFGQLGTKLKGIKISNVKLQLYEE